MTRDEVFSRWIKAGLAWNADRAWVEKLMAFVEAVEAREAGAREPGVFEAAPACPAGYALIYRVGGEKGS